jgi:hypothetical protein
VVELYSWPATEERKEIIPQSEIYIIIHVFENPRRLTIEQWFDARWGSSRDKSHEQVVSVNGLRAIKQVVTDLVAPLRFISLTFASGDKVYSIRAQPPNSRHLPEFEQIARSFRNPL